MGSEVRVHLEDTLEKVRNGNVRKWEVKSVYTLRTRWKTLETERLSSESWSLCTPGQHDGKTLETERLSSESWGLCTPGEWWERGSAYTPGEHDGKR